MPSVIKRPSEPYSHESSTEKPGHRTPTPRPNSPTPPPIQMRKRWRWIKRKSGLSNETTPTDNETADNTPERPTKQPAPNAPSRRKPLKRKTPGSPSDKEGPTKKRCCGSAEETTTEKPYYMNNTHKSTDKTNKVELTARRLTTPQTTSSTGKLLIELSSYKKPPQSTRPKAVRPTPKRPNSTGNIAEKTKKHVTPTNPKFHSVSFKPIETEELHKVLDRLTL